MFSDPRPYFESLPDPRRDTKNKLHKLNEIIFIVLCAVLSGVEDWVGMEAWAEAKIDWLRQFIVLPHGIPSHDTLGGVMGRINSKHFAACFARWVEDALPSLAGEHIAVDGKTLRGSRDHAGAVHVVSAFASRTRWVLAQQAVDGKSNEIPATSELLDLLDIRGATITLDAMGCQKKIAKQIIDRKADYVLAIKENQFSFYDEVKQRMDSEEAAGNVALHETIDQGHGRFEIRQYFLSDKVDVPQRAYWEGLAAIGMVESIRDVKGVVSKERRYFLTSFNDLTRFAEIVRAHWSIENQEHWVLDVQFHEDQNRARKDHSAENLAVIRRMALNILRRDTEDKRSLRNRKIRAAFDDGYRTALIFGKREVT
jgi:predicted transposase YbfD/YdcC